MQLRDYVRAVAARWVWVVVGGLVGLVLCSAAASLAPVAYRSSVALYVGAAVVDGPQDPAYATLVQSQILPSVAALGTSTGVLEQASDETGLPVRADAVTAEIRGDSDVLDVAVTADTPADAQALARAVGSALQRQAQQLYPRTDTPLLTVVAVDPADPPAEVTTLGRSSGAALGLGAGAVLAALAAGLVELARPRVRGRRDVAPETSAPVLPLPAARSAGARRPSRADVPERPEQLALLHSLVRAAAPARVAVTGPAIASGRSAVGDELAAGSHATEDLVEVVPVADPRGLAAAGPVDGVVLVTDACSTTRGELRGALDALETTGVPVLAVVVDGLLPSRPGWRARLRAGVHGDARWSAEIRAGGPGTDGPAGTATRLVAALAVAALGFTRPLPFALSTGLLAAVALLPVWLPAVRRARAATPLFVLAGVALLSGALLTWFSSGEHALRPHDAVRTAVLVATAVCGVGLIVWARSVLPLPAVALSFGGGALLTGLVTMMAASENPWKFSLSFPVTVIVLSVAVTWRRPLFTVAALGVLGVVDVLNDYRSALGFCGLAALLVLWQARPTGGAQRFPRWMGIPLVAAVVAGGYAVLSRLLVSGLLGAELQQRTAAQIAESGSLLLGGRPEWTASWALMRHQPLGYGLGVVPTSQDVQVAKQGLAVTHVPTVDGYLEHYMLNGGFELHSIIADLWVSLGPVGIVLGLAMGALLVHGLAQALGARRASGLVCFLVPLGLWNLAFGPLPSDVSALTLGLGLLLVTASPSARRVPAAARELLPRVAPV